MVRDWTQDFLAYKIEWAINHLVKLEYNIYIFIIIYYYSSTLKKYQGPVFFLLPPTQTFFVPKYKLKN